MIWMHEGLFCSLVFVFVFDSESLAGFLSPSASLPASQPRLCTGKGRREGGGRGLGAPNLKALGFQGKTLYFIHPRGCTESGSGMCTLMRGYIETLSVPVAS